MEAKITIEKDEAEFEWPTLIFDTKFLGILNELGELSNGGLSSFIEEDLIGKIESVFEEIELQLPGLVKRLKEDYDYASLKERAGSGCMIMKGKPLRIKQYVGSED